MKKMMLNEKKYLEKEMHKAMSLSVDVKMFWMGKSKVADWYKKTYVTDKLGKEIKDDITFEGVWNALKKRDNIYEYIGVFDSLVRERIFMEMIENRGYDGELLYRMW